MKTNNKVSDDGVWRISVSHSFASSHSSTEEEAALLHFKSLRHEARLKRVPMVAIVLLLSVVAVWGINWNKLNLVASYYRDQALLRRSDTVAVRLQKSFEKCEDSIRHKTKIFVGLKHLKDSFFLGKCNERC